MVAGAHPKMSTGYMSNNICLMSQQTDAFLRGQKEEQSQQKRINKKRKKEKLTVIIIKLLPPGKRVKTCCSLEKITRCSTLLF